MANNLVSREFVDRASRDIFTRQALLKQYLRGCLPEEVFARLDFTRARLCPNERIDPFSHKKVADQIWEIPWMDDPDRAPLLVCVLIEHQSKADKHMPFRILVHVVHYWLNQYDEWVARQEERLAQQRAAKVKRAKKQTIKEERFQLAIPLATVFYSGESEWQGPRNLEDMFADTPLLRQFIPQLKVTYWELRNHSSEELLNSSDEFMKAMACLKLETADLDQLSEAVENITSALIAEDSELPQDAKVSLLRLVVGLITRKRTREEQAMLAESAPKKDELEWYREVMADLNPKSALAEGVKKGFIKGRKGGRKEGREEGLDEGRLEESKYFLTSMAEKKWGHPLGEPVNQVIRKCNNHDKIRQLVHQLDLINSEADLIKLLQTA